MKRQWPRVVVHVEKGWALDLTREQLHKIARKDKRRSHKRERAQARKDVEHD